MAHTALAVSDDVRSPVWWREGRWEKEEREKERERERLVLAMETHVRQVWEGRKESFRQLQDKTKGEEGRMRG
jgi:hypothetical protein